MANASGAMRQSNSSGGTSLRHSAPPCYVSEKSIDEALDPVLTGMFDGWQLRTQLPGLSTPPNARISLPDGYDPFVVWPGNRDFDRATRKWTHFRLCALPNPIRPATPATIAAQQTSLLSDYAMRRLIREPIWSQLGPAALVLHPSFHRLNLPPE